MVDSAKKPTANDIIPPELAIKAMRDGGYKNTAYALAELIDNSVQAQSKNVELICIENYKDVNGRNLKRINQIGVIDNGFGMQSETLQSALQFGNGTHLTDRKGIGRFGMGLPNSSISQCRRVEVWSWQENHNNAIYTYLDLDDIATKKQTTVPEPTIKALPSNIQEWSNCIGKNGTLVLWSELEEHRLSWRGAIPTLRNTEDLVGRMFRKFIDNKELSIRLLGISEDDNIHDHLAKVNDPLYLMENSSTPEPFNKNPMFERWDEGDKVFPIDYKGGKHEVHVRFSLAKEETIPKDNIDRGNKIYGKHAAKNVGLSIVREGRELELDPAWAQNFNPVERWWGAEIEFPSILDEVFGVTNNKQNATKLAQMAKFDWKEEAESGESKAEFIKRFQEEGDPRGVLIPITDYVHEQLGIIRIKLSAQTKGRRSGEKGTQVVDTDDIVSEKFKKRADGGHTIESDNITPSKKDSELIKEELTEKMDYSDSVAKEIAEAIIHNERKFITIAEPLDGYSFFTIKSMPGGVTAMVFNENHPFYSQLIDTLNPEFSDESKEQLKERLRKAAETLKILFAAWARYELEDKQVREKLFEFRQEWGKMSKEFLDDGQSSFH